MDIVVERPSTGDAFLTKQGGGLQPQAKLQVVVDGYSAPITAGNFVRNVQSGMYDNTKLSSNYTSVTIAPSEPSPTGGAHCFQPTPCLCCTSPFPSDFCELFQCTL